MGVPSRERGKAGTLRITGCEYPNYYVVFMQNNALQVKQT
jgi:hypothetical protein